MIGRHAQQATATRRSAFGFTIVELLIVIVIIGILAAIVIISYNGVRGRAVDSLLKKDASGAWTQIEAYRVENGSYPNSTNDTNGGSGLTVGDDTTTQYSLLSGDFCLSVTSSLSSSLAYYVRGSTGSEVFSGVCAGHNSPGNSLPAGYEAAPLASGGSDNIGGYSPIQPESCPTTGGTWTKVPGNSLYGLDNGFCVHTYPAANVGGVATSQANVARWTTVNITQAQANAATAATGAHLITEQEWMTIAANAAMQPANWSGGAVGSGTLPRGSTTASRGVQSVVLSNGERFYFDTNAANVTGHTISEWTCFTGTNASNCGLQRQYLPSPGQALYTDQFALFTNYNSLQSNGTYYYGDPRYANPSLNAYVNSSRTAGLGYLRSDYVAGNTTVYTFTRGYWTGVNTAGLFTLYLYTDSVYAYSSLGFRAAR